MRPVVVVVAVVMLAFAAQPQHTGEKKITVLKNTADSAWKNPARHKAFDVEVARLRKFLSDTTDAYWINMYLRSPDGQLLVDGDAFLELAQRASYDVAFYRWLDDSTVAVRLYDSASKREQKITKGKHSISKE